MESGPPPRDLIADYMSDLPVLQPPLNRADQDITLSMLMNQQREIALTNCLIHLHCRDIEDLKKKRMALLAAHIKKIQENVEKSQQSNAWGMFGKIVAWLGSLFSIAAGGVAIATGAGTGAGIAMILAGVALLSTQLLSEFGIFEKLAEKLSGGDLKKKETILQQLQLWSMIASVCLSVGGFAAGYTAVIAGGVGGAVMASLQGVLQVANGTATIGKAVTESQRIDAEATSNNLAGRISIADQTHKEIAAKQKEMMTRWKSWTEQSDLLFKLANEKMNAISQMSAPAA
jgi:hypothetical protein